MILFLVAKILQSSLGMKKVKQELKNESGIAININDAFVNIRQTILNLLKKRLQRKMMRIFLFVVVGGLRQEYCVNGRKKAFFFFALYKCSIFEGKIYDFSSYYNIHMPSSYVSSSQHISTLAFLIFPVFFLRMDEEGFLCITVWDKFDPLL